ncbi:hypothetical protein GJ496_002074 [Pomphorhynchus laevis]|nr:hypothetical protein GJ496_002074 [Pomphorhynchus laevis]
MSSTKLEHVANVKNSILVIPHFNDPVWAHMCVGANSSRQTSLSEVRPYFHYHAGSIYDAKRSIYLLRNSSGIRIGQRLQTDQTLLSS